MMTTRKKISELCAPNLRNLRTLLVMIACLFALTMIGCGSDEGGDPLADASADGGLTGGTPSNTACGTDPSDVDVCASAADCSTGEICAPTPSCVPSVCSCDAATGSWLCTTDCGMPNVCQPAATQCTTPDPSQVATCRDTDECERNEVCAPSPNCVPSTCSCDVASDTWSCTLDCGMPNVCQPAANLCTTPDPSQVTTCGDRAECGRDEVCAPSPTCVPSSCSCDPAANAWVCSEDCGMPNVCQPEPMACTPPFGNALCSQTEDCNPGEVCTRNHGQCVPSACSCDPETGEWICTTDCGGGLCLPSSGSCGGDSECTMGSEWCEGGDCIPCDNSGQLCDIDCPAGFELEVRNGCTPCNCVPSSP